MPRPLAPDEVADLLALDVAANLATLDRDGFPHVTPIWFVWRPPEFLMTSQPDKPHVRRLGHDDRAGLSVHVEGAEQPDGQRLNRQVRVIGRAVVEPDLEGQVTAEITRRYVHGPGAPRMVSERTRVPRMLIRLRPTRVVAVASY